MSAVVLSGCGSSASLEFANGSPTIAADAGDDSPYPDGATSDDTPPPATDAAPGLDAGEAPKCPPGKDGKANVCVTVVPGTDAPTLTEAAKTAHALDGKGALLIGLTSVKPAGRDISFVAQTWLPTESSSTGTLATSELPKSAELSVPPGTYWAFAVFRDQEPYIRPTLAVGDYVPRFVELKEVTVVEDMGANVEVKLHPVRAVDVEVRMTTSPSGSGAGPVGAWLVGEDKRIAGEGRHTCVDLNGGGTATVRVFTTYTGELDVAAALFDLGTPVEDGTGTLGSFPPGTVHNDPSLTSVLIPATEWVVPAKRRVDLDRVVPLGGLKPADPSPTCASYAYAPPK